MLMFNCSEHAQLTTVGGNLDDVEVRERDIAAFGEKKDLSASVPVSESLEESSLGQPVASQPATTRLDK